MIPENINEFLTRQIFLHVGTRDAKLRPREILAWGVKTGEDKKSLTVFIPESIAEKTLSNLNDNGKIALTCVFAPTHECYQFKGHFVSSRPATDHEHTFLNNYAEGYGEILKMIGKPADFFSPIQHSPSLAITFEIKDLFVQTPGPNAGNKII